MEEAKLSGEVCAVCGQEATTRCRRCRKPYCSPSCRLQDFVKGGHRKECRRASRSDSQGSERTCWCNMADCEECRIARALEDAAKASENKVIILKRRYGCEPGDERVVIGAMDNGSSWLLDDGRWIPKADEGVYWDWTERRKKRKKVAVETDEPRVPKPRVSQFQRHIDGVARQRRKLAQALFSRQAVRESGGLLAYVTADDHAAVRSKFLAESQNVRRPNRKKRSLRAVVWVVLVSRMHKNPKTLSTNRSKMRTTSTATSVSSMARSIKKKLASRLRGEQQAAKAARQNQIDLEAEDMRKRARAEAEKIMRACGEWQQLETLRRRKNLSDYDKHALDKLETKLATETQLAEDRLRKEDKARLRLGRYENFQRMLRERDAEVIANRQRFRAQLEFPFRRASQHFRAARTWAIQKYGEVRRASLPVVTPSETPRRRRASSPVMAFRQPPRSRRSSLPAHLDVERARRGSLRPRRGSLR